MPRGPRVLMDNACYHVIVRGNQQKEVFREDSDFEYYLVKLRKYKRIYDVLLYSYCLMPNHIHMAVEILGDSKKLSSFMHAISRSYTAYFNKKYNKVGYLWQGRFKSLIINKDKYLFNCLNYIEYNPPRAKLTEYPEQYKYSSYNERVLGIIDGYRLLNDLVV